MSGGTSKKIHLRKILRRLADDQRGAALVEMAIVLPLLLAFLLGIISYGSWIALAHSVQQSANEGARASLAGLTQEERSSLVTTATDKAIAKASNIDLKKVSIVVHDDGETLIVRVSYDASKDPLLSLSLVPLPEGPIEREAAVSLRNI